LKTKYQFTDAIELLELIRDFDDKQAYEEFVQRFLPTVKDECLTKCKLRKIDQQVGQQIAHDTFEKIRKSKSFDREKLNGNESNSSIKGWLYRISTNLFYDYHNSQKVENQLCESYFDDLLFIANEMDVDSLREKRDIAVKIIAKLSPKEREVVLTDFEYKRSHKYLPEEVNDSLANRIGVKKASIRKIRERAIFKLKQAIDEINK